MRIDGELLERAAAARFALLGEATHGAHEFYAVRAQITKRLIETHGFRAVAAEADWPDAYRVNCFVRGVGDDRDADDARAFRLFPAGMWRNEGAGWGELNLGQLVREAHGRDAFLLGFSTYSGTVTAASGWDGAAERKHVRPALAGSYEAYAYAV